MGEHEGVLASGALYFDAAQGDAAQEPRATPHVSTLEQVYDTGVTPSWIGKTDTFWYAYRTSGGTRYWRVDCRQATKAPLFDHAKLDTLLSEATQKPLDAAEKPYGESRLASRVRTTTARRRPTRSPRSRCAHSTAVACSMPDVF